jgi:curved DNA-binding protein CbpA
MGRNDCMNPYEILGVEKTTSQKDIKKAYRSLSKKHHPDIGGDPAIFTPIAEAYYILSDPDKRSYWDEFGEVKPMDEEAAKRIWTAAISMFFEIAQKNPPDLSGALEHQINSDVTKARVECKQLQKAGLSIQKAKDRILKAPENDILGAALDSEIEKVSISILKEMKNIDLLENIREFFALYDFEKQITSTFSYTTSESRIIYQVPNNL